MSESAIRTLLVTQNADVANQMEGLLKQAAGHFSVARSDSARNAVESCKSSTPDCIFYDQNGNDDDGTTFLQLLSEQCGRGAAPVIVLVAEEKKPQLAKLLKAGAVDYLLLPALEPDLVSRAVRHALERWVLEKRLMEQRNLFKAVLGGSPGFIALKNSDLQYQAVNGAFCAFLGKSQEEIAGKSDEILFPKSEADTYKKDDLHVLKNGLPQTKRVDMTGVEGVRSFEIVRTPIIDSTGTIAGVFFAAHDVTTAKELESRVEALQGTLRSISEDQAELVCRVAAKGVLTFVNDATCRAFAKKESELLGQGFSMLIPKASQTEVRDLLASLKPGNPAGRHRQAVTLGDGPPRWQEWTTRAIYGDDGKLVEFVCVGHDVTGFVEQEQACAQLKQDVGAKDLALAEATEARQAAEKELADLKRSFEERAGEFAQLQQEVEKHSQAFANIDRQLAEKTQELQALQEKNSQAEAAVRESRARVEEQERALQQSRKDAEARAIAQSEREAAAAELERRVQEMEQAGKATEAAMADRERQARQAQERSEGLQAELAAMSQQLQDFVALVPSGILELAAGMKITSMSPAVCTILGCKPEDAQSGLVLLDFLRQDDRKGATECMKESMQQKKVTSGEFGVVRRDGSRTEVVLSAVPVIREGKIQGMMVALTDVSPGKQAGKMIASVRRLANATLATAGMISGVARLTAGLVEDGAGDLDGAKLDALERAAQDAREVLEDLLSSKRT